MGVFDLFSKDGRAQRARESNIKRAVNKYAQSPDRMKALQSLRDDGSPEALYGLLRRFGMKPYQGIYLRIWPVSRVRTSGHGTA